MRLDNLSEAHPERAVGASHFELSMRFHFRFLYRAGGFMRTHQIGAAVLVSLFISVSAMANGIPVSTLIAVDENGHIQFNGSLGPAGVLAADPGPGGLPSVLTYALPFTGTQGDVFLTDADAGN